MITISFLTVKVNQDQEMKADLIKNLRKKKKELDQKENGEKDVLIIHPYPRRRTSLRE